MQTPVTIRATDDGELEIADQEFIQQLIALGFKPGRNNSAERLEAILQHVPEEYRQDFWNGFHSR